MLHVRLNFLCFFVLAFDVLCMSGCVCSSKEEGNADFDFRAISPGLNGLIDCVSFESVNYPEVSFEY